MSDLGLVVVLTDECSPPHPTRNSLGPKVRHLLKFNLSFQCSLVVHVFSMVFAMVIFCKVIFYYGPELRH